MVESASFWKTKEAILMDMRSLGRYQNVSCASRSIQMWPKCLGGRHEVYRSRNHIWRDGAINPSSHTQAKVRLGQGGGSESKLGLCYLLHRWVPRRGPDPSVFQRALSCHASGKKVSWLVASTGPAWARVLCIWGLLSRVS